MTAARHVPSSNVRCAFASSSRCCISGVFDRFSDGKRVTIPKGSERITKTRNVVIRMKRPLTRTFQIHRNGPNMFFVKETSLNECVLFEAEDGSCMKFHVHRVTYSTLFKMPLQGCASQAE